MRDLSPDADKGVLDGKFKSNPFVDSMFDDLRPHVQQLLQDVIVIRMVMNMRVAEMEVKFPDRDWTIAPNAPGRGHHDVGQNRSLLQRDHGELG